VKATSGNALDGSWARPQALPPFWSVRSACLPGVLALAAIALVDWLVGQEVRFGDYLASVGLGRRGTFDYHLAFGTLELAPFAVTVLAAIIFWALGRERTGRVVFYVALVFATLTDLTFTATVANTITHRSGNLGATVLLLDAGAVWILNVVVFATWYWMMDAGGPHRRGTAREGRRDFRFVQDAGDVPGYEAWRPAYNDYLHTAFLVSVTLSVANMDVLSHRAKNLTMLQALVSLVILGVLVARAINAFAG
jgi:hypothetical protein